MDTESLLIAGTACLIFGAIAALLPPDKGKHYIHIISFLGSAAYAAAGVLIISASSKFSAAMPLSRMFSFSFSGDGISGLFILIIAVLSCAASVYAIGYCADMKHKGLMTMLFHLFVLTMFAVVLSGNVITFLISWEAMSLISYFLVTIERDDESAKAGLVYAVMTHIGTAFLIAMFLILYKYTGSMDFAAMKQALKHVPDGVKAVVFAFALIGFGTKAGIIPLHIWLPRAHPAAPSHVSALMSGVMIKTGIYGILRIVLDILGGGNESWGVIILIAGILSSVLGVMYALMEHDIKRLLAYHSVENIGIILLGIGAAIIFKSHGLTALASAALIAGLYHTINHALFKGLLFLGAGSVLHGIHTKNMEEMGGLLRTMPLTGLFFLVGSLAICAFPPFNGFVSEWLTYQSLLLGYDVPSLVSKVVSPLGGAALALTGALAAACFVKAFGISFLGMPRSQHAEQAHESSPSMIAGMAALAVLCLAMGIFPSVAVKLTTPATVSMSGSYPSFAVQGFAIVNQNASAISGLGILFTLSVMAVATLMFLRITGGKATKVSGDSWDCGLPALTPRMQYTATAFTKPIKLIFKKIYLPRRAIRVTYLIKPYFVKSVQYHGEITPLFERFIYEPFIRVIHAVAHRVKLIQSGSLHLYLGYILLTLVLLLMFGR